MPSDPSNDQLLSGVPAISLWERLREREEWTDDEREQVLDDLFPGDHRVVPYVKRFSTLIVLSTMIAAFGLLANSAAVVIGAMLVAPLMTPMLALAASLIYAEMRRFIGALLMIVFGTVAAIAVGWFVALIASGGVTPESLDTEILARTSPSLLDLGIAVAAGLAGGYVLTHKGSTSSLPGVAIAVALVPPLATVGVTLRLGATDLASGALLLYTTNLIAIVLSASIVMLASGFVPDHIRQLARGKMGIRLLPWAIALAAVAVPLAIHTKAVIENEAFSRLVSQTVTQWDPRATILNLDTSIGGERANVSITVATTGDGRPAWELAQLIADSSDTDVDIDVKYQDARTDAASTS
ncbi:MAG: DUF389 domain-containing protein [Acidimicrobiia bacterium]